MSRELSRRRLLASTGLVLAGGALPNGVGSTAAQPASRPPPETRWSRTYGEARQNQASAAVETDDGALVVAGSTRSESGVEPWLFAVDRQSGRGRWQRTVPNETLSEDAQPQPSDVDAAGDGVAVLGSSFVDGRLELLRATARGEVVWRRLYSSDVDGATALGTSVESVGEGFVLGGYRITREDSATRATAVVRKVDREGAQQWRHALFPDQLSLLVSTRALGGGEYLGLVWLQEEPPEDGGERPPVRSALAKFDDDGSVAWTREYAAGPDGDPNQSNQLTGFVPTEGGYLLAGRTVTGTASDGATRGWVVVTDEAGVVRTENTFGPAAFNAISAVDGSDGRYYLAGQVAESAGAESRRGWLVRVGTDGDVAWSVTPSVHATSGFQDVLATGDGGVSVAGTTSLDGEQAQDATGPVSEAWLAKLGGDAPPAAATPEETPTPEPTSTTAPASTPGETPTPEPTLTPTPEPVPGETEDGATDPATSTTSGGGPGFTVGGALAGLGGLWLRRSDVDLGALLSDRE